MELQLLQVPITSFLTTAPPTDHLPRLAKRGHTVCMLALWQVHGHLAFAVYVRHGLHTLTRVLVGYALPTI